MANASDSSPLQTETENTPKTISRAVFEGEVSTSSIGERWALVVGISDYKDESLNLDYADADAQAFHDLLITPSGGQFKESNIELLLNEEATTANITKALRSFMKRPQPDDLVLIYFACHGSPDFELHGEDKAVFLLTHDTDPDDISGTALPMDDINWSLRKILKSKKVIILADTCHSAEIGGKGLRAAGSPNITNAYLKRLSESKDGAVLIASTQAGELAQESDKWGGGHGVFTYFLLKGMGGAADTNGDGMVSIEELYKYVETNVTDATNKAQKPAISSGKYDRRLPISFPAWFRAQQHYELGCQLSQIGNKLSESSCLLAAEKHLKRAIDLADLTQNNLPQANLKKGLVLMADERLYAAISTLEDALNLGIKEAAYYLGIAYLKQGRKDEAIQKLELFLRERSNSDKTAWAEILISFLKTSSTAKRHALLIGINYPEGVRLRNNLSLKPLNACVNDINLLGKILADKLSFNIRKIEDSEATYSNIKQAFSTLRQQVNPNDTVVVHFSGYEILGHWIAYDAGITDAGEQLNTIASEELYQMFVSIPCLHKYLIMDSAVSHEFEELIELLKNHKDCTLLLAASPGQLSYEMRNEDASSSFGVFTYYLSDILSVEDNIKELTQGEVFQLLKQSVNKQFPKQEPFFLGDRQKKLFSAELNYSPTLFELTHNHWKISLNELADLYENSLIQSSYSFPDMYLQFGLAFAARGNFSKAIDVLSKYLQVQTVQKENKDILFTLGCAQFKSKLYLNAVETFQKYLKSAELKESLRSSMSRIISQVQTLESPFHVLLVGIDVYLHDDNKNLMDNHAVDSIFAIREVLIENFHFKDSDFLKKGNREEEFFYINMLPDEEATVETILKEFKELVEYSPNPTLFYFSGRGTVDAEGNPVILATDSRQDGVPGIRVDQLAEIANATDSNLISIIDACWTVSKTPNTHYEPTKGQEFDKGQNIESIERSSTQIPRIGYITLYPESIKYQQKERVKQNFSTELIQVLKNAEVGSLSYWKLRQIFAQNQVSTNLNDYIGNIYISSDDNILDEEVFSNPLIAKFQSILQKIEQVPIKHTVGIIREFIEQQNGFSPSEYLNLGITNYILGDYNDSILALQTAINQLSKQSSESINQNTLSIHAQAHYWLGRVLHERRLDPARAVSELRLAIRYNSSNIGAYYYLGKALQVLGGPEILAEARSALLTYLKKGTPLGHRKEVKKEVDKWGATR